MITTIDQERLDRALATTLKKGAHDRWSRGACVMEAVAYVAREKFSDHPECACPVLGAFMRSWNDSLGDEDRQRLKPYVVRLVGTKSTPEVENERSWLACDWLVRTFTPAWLRLAGLTEDADALEALPPLTAAKLAKAATPVIEKARKNGAAAWAAAWAAAGAAWAAAGDAAGGAAWAAAGGAARAAARAAAWGAAGGAAGGAARAAAWGAAAWAAAAWAAAWDAARDAAWAAAGAAAGPAALAPTVTALQTSAFELLDRMIAVQAK